MIDWLRQLMQQILAFFRKEPLDQELEAEMASHLEFAIQEKVQRGISSDEARRQALVRFGGVQQAREKHRESRGLPTLDILLQDLRYTFRTLRRESSFTCIAILILALGIGSNIAVFGVVNTILLRPLPFQDSQRLAWLAAGRGKGGLSDVTYTVDAYEEFKRHNQSFQEVTSYQTFFNSIQYKLTGYGEPKPVFGIQVADNFFETLRIQPVLGRLFTEQECQKGGRPAALLSYPFWQRQFSGDPAILGKAITLNGQAITVVGILPKTFDFGSVFSPGLKVDFYVPAVMDFWRTWGNTLAIVGRLKPGVSVAQAQAEADILFPRLKSAHPDWFNDYSTKVSELKDYVSGKLRRSLLVLWCAVGLILLIICVNLSNLMLVRAAARSKEFAMRGALGASRARIIRQLLTENLVLALSGALLGLMLAFTAILYLSRQGSIALPLLSSLGVDGQTLLWTLLIAIAAAVLVGITPALRLSDRNLHGALKDSDRGTSGGRKHDRLRSVMVISEVALACVLLVGAGLLLRSFLRVLEVDLGFQPSHAAAIKVDYDDGGNPLKRSAILQEMVRRVNALPGIESAGIADMLPLDRNRSWGLAAKGVTYPKDYNLGIFVYVISPQYLQTIGIHLKEGRDFTWQDSSKSEPVVILNEAAARHFFPGEDPVGRMADTAGRDTRVIGVVSDVRESSVEDSASPQMYLPIMQRDPEGAELVVRTRLAPSALASGVMGTLRSINPGQPAAEFRPIQQIVDHSVSPRRFIVLLVTSFAALGLILASLGIYGVISYSVTRQTQEIGIRMALGASRTRVQFDVIARTFMLTSLGVVLGTIGSFGVSKGITSLLFGTEPTDPQVFAGVIFLLGAVALIAGYIPAFRASRVNPAVALRNS
jgi:putative ABC transport system permease protein